jgi:DNA-binding transcriptional LysR family regulator
MDARQLQVFLAVVEHGGITRAASALHVAQPSLSHSIKQLERELRGELFVRTKRGVQLTAAGRSLVEPAQQVLRDLTVARESVRDVLGLRGGTLDIVAVPAMAINPLAPLIGRYRERFPEVLIRVLDPADVGDAAALVRSGVCEIGVVDDVVPGAGLEAYDFEPQEMCLVLPPGSSIGPGAVTWDELGKYEYVTGTPGRSVSRAVLERIFAQTGRELRICVESDHRSTIADFMLAGAGAALLRRPIAEGLRDRGAQVRDLAPAVAHRVHLIHRKDIVGPAARAFVTLAIDTRSPTRETAPAAEDR